MASGIRRVSAPFPTPDPFLFAVYHRDFFPAAANAKMHAPMVGNGVDFDASRPYRMYHGTRVPGFPAHPHRGFETITATIEGVVDHCDSLGNGGRYGGEGCCQFMTAGSGIVHAEMFPLIHQDKPNTLRLFQIWLNLPREDKAADPAFLMHWKCPHVVSPDGLAKTTVYAGRFGDAVEPVEAPPRSWAARPDADVAVWFIEMQKGASVRLPVARAGDKANRRMYVVEGEGVLVEGVRVAESHMCDLETTKEVELHAEGECAVLCLQGVPIGEPVVQHGPFVGNEPQDIIAAFSDYNETKFGGWPWPSDDFVFPADKGRFTVINGVETPAPNPEL